MAPPTPSRFPSTAVDAAELLPDGIVTTIGGAPTVRFMNERAERITGLARDEVVGRDIREALPFQDSNGESWWGLTDPWSGLRTRTGHREKLLLLPNGHEVLLTARYIRPGRSQPVQSVVCALRDAEARRRAEADHAALISTISHELRSPLTGVKGFSSTLLRRWDRFSDEQKRLMLETIEADADRVTRLITELLDVSRIDSGRLRIHAQPLDTRSAFTRHVERYAATGVEPDRFAIDVEDGGEEIWADPDRLDQVLANLVENALKHGSGTVGLHCRPADGGRLARGLRRRTGHPGREARGRVLPVLARPDRRQHRPRPLHRPRPRRGTRREGGRRRGSRWGSAHLGNVPAACPRARLRGGAGVALCRGGSCRAPRAAWQRAECSAGGVGAGEWSRPGQGDFRYRSKLARDRSRLASPPRARARVLPRSGP